MPRIKINGLNVHYQQAGSGPDVVLIHAFTANLSVWMFINILETLAAEFRVTAYDIRGHGMTTVTPGGYTSAELAEDLRRLHAALGLGPAYLVGHSFGGVIGMHLAADHPELVRGVILSDSYFPGLKHLEPDMGQAGPWQDLRQTIRAAGTDIGESVDFGRLFRTMAGLTPEQMGGVKQQMGAPGARWISQITQLAATSAAEDAFAEAGLTAERIAAVACPVVALYDEHSPFGATCRFLQERLRDCAVEIVPGAKHVAPLQNSEAFVELVQKHLRRMNDRG
ncbi:MAG: alpha/beta hydrolase [Planctomycetes bacterium]|nr:alpha/beta hydrolase [Planctomycetota bacterium]